MNLEILRTLVEVADRGSQSAAARYLGISQPAVSKQLQRLEEELGTRLLARGRRGAQTLTPAGERVLAFAREILARADELAQDLAGLQAEVQGVVHVAASTIPGEYLLPGLLARFRKAYPLVEARLTIAGTSDVVAKLASGEADIGFVGAAVDHPRLTFEPFDVDEVVVTAPADHAFAGRTTVSMAELAEQPLILRESGSGTRLSVEAALARQGLSLPAEATALVLGSTAAVIQAVEQGLGVGFVSARSVVQPVAAGQLVCLRVQDLDLRRPLYLAHVDPIPGSRAVQVFLAFVRERAHDRSNPGS
jgi:DNA-binding transcriptional LysR family regulator